MGFNLDGYQTVKERKKIFYDNYSTGVIHVEIISSIDKVMEYVVFQARIWKTRESCVNKEPPDSIGNALEWRDVELKENQYGQKYESVNYSAWVENCEESAIGRAFDNMGISNMKCSAEEMKKVQAKTQSKKPLLVVDQNVLDNFITEFEGLHFPNIIVCKTDKEKENLLTELLSKDEFAKALQPKDKIYIYKALINNLKITNHK